MTPKKRIGGFIVAGIIVVIGLWLLIAGMVSIGTGEIAVMTRYGRVTGQELGEGFHLKNPLDHANVYDVKIQKQESDATAASKDLQDVNAKVVVNYHLERGQISHIHQTVGVEYHDKLIAPAVQETFKATTAKFDATELITNRNEVKSEVSQQLTDRLAKYGILIDSVSITNFAFSKEFSASIEAKQVAQQNAEQAQFNLQKAQLDAQAQQAQKASLSPELLQKYAIDKWDGKMPTYVGGGSVFNIPLTQ
jgi:prohibitin 1